MASRPSVWYIRRGTVVRGPFPRGLIARYVILGRIALSDELSEDLEHWMPLAELPQLIPDVVLEDGPDSERLAAARRWEDERTDDGGFAAPAGGGADRRGDGGDMRGPALRHESLSAHQFRRRRLKCAAAAIALGIFGAVAAVLVFYQPPPPPPSADCRAAPRPGVNWENCAMDGRALAHSDLTGARMKNMSLSGADLGASRLVGVDLSFTNLSISSLRGANLSHATLLGTSLRGADLTDARLDHADLSYADLRGAIMPANLRDARLDSAVWVDGSLCGPGSLGECLAAEP